MGSPQPPQQGACSAAWLSTRGGWGPARGQSDLPPEVKRCVARRGAVRAHGGHTGSAGICVSGEGVPAPEARGPPSRRRQGWLLLEDSAPARQARSAASGLRLSLHTPAPCSVRVLHGAVLLEPKLLQQGPSQPITPPSKQGPAHRSWGRGSEHLWVSRDHSRPPPPGGGGLGETPSSDAAHGPRACLPVSFFICSFCNSLGAAGFSVALQGGPAKGLTGGDRRNEPTSATGAGGWGPGPGKGHQDSW